MNMVDMVIMTGSHRLKSDGSARECSLGVGKYDLTIDGEVIICTNSIPSFPQEKMKNKTTPFFERNYDDVDITNGSSQ